MFKHFRLLRPGVSILLMFFGSMLLLRNEVRGNWERKFPLNDSTSNVGPWLSQCFTIFKHCKGGSEIRSGAEVGGSSQLLGA